MSKFKAGKKKSKDITKQVKEEKEQEEESSEVEELTQQQIEANIVAANKARVKGQTTASASLDTLSTELTELKSRSIEEFADKETNLIKCAVIKGSVYCDKTSVLVKSVSGSKLLPLDQRVVYCPVNFVKKNTDAVQIYELAVMANTLSTEVAELEKSYV